ncbi:MAG: hypothetical protein MI723_00675, partial [Caulobacterales bacterium]|nr:hypothetical protein [Caulobacterales bacterium]
DQSGGLTLEELTEAAENSPMGSAKGAGGPSIEERFNSLDADGDGTLTQDEFMSAKPPAPPHGSFSPDMMTSLLALQSGEESSSITSLFSSLTETEETSEADLVDALIDSLQEAEEA